MVAAEIATGYSALKSAYEIARGLKDINDRVALNAAVIDLQEKILSAQESAAAAKQTLRELQDTIAAFENWSATAARYQLKDFGEGTFAYELKPDAGTGEPHHLACPNCFEKRVRSVLQFQAKANGREIFKCVNCDTQYALGIYVPWRPPENRRRSPI
ncbi:MAG TPA: hypothetical protein VGN97_01125 [Mesorhizobium sp.]|jgi:hypothetical protein|nr:hypothetical protein [Mesorhizobium sp.]